MSLRVVDEVALQVELRKMFGAGERRYAEGRFFKWLAEQPLARPEGKLPELVSASAAAKMLGVYPSHIARLRKQGRMPAAVPVEGGKGDAWRKDEVAALAEELRKEREARQQPIHIVRRGLAVREQDAVADRRDQDVGLGVLGRDVASCRPRRAVLRHTR